MVDNIQSILKYRFIYEFMKGKVVKAEGQKMNQTNCWWFRFNWNKL